MKSTHTHPQGLKVLFFTEMWERFSYYGMRGFLVLYLVTEATQNGFGLNTTEALKIYGTFTGLVYLTPILGGYLADNFLGQRKAVFIGAILMAIGQFCMAYSEFGEMVVRETFRNTGLGLIILGTGFFKANISTMVGDLYTENDVRKDSAFTIFYLGINLGALFGPLVTGLLAENIDWFLGFMAAGIGMVISIFWFYFQRDKLASAGMPPGRQPVDGKFHLNNKDRFDILLYVLASTAIVAAIIQLLNVISDKALTLIIRAILIIGGTLLFIVITKNTKGKTAWSKMGVILILAFFNVFFWAGYEQGGGTFNLFAKNNTNLSTVFGTIPASWFQGISALYIVLFASAAASIWMWLNSIGKEPRTPVKFGIGLLLMSVGFVIINKAAQLSSDGTLVSPLWLLSVYFMHVLGELCLSPIGLSMITKLAPQKIVSVMMGVWFGSVALGNMLAGFLQSILKNHLPDMHLYTFLTISTFVAGILLLILSPVLNKMMKGIH